MLSEAERQFLNDVINDNTKKYSSSYKYVLKHRILNKRRTLTDDLLLVNAALDKLQSLWHPFLGLRPAWFWKVLPIIHLERKLMEEAGRIIIFSTSFTNTNIENVSPWLSALLRKISCYLHNVINTISNLIYLFMTFLLYSLAADIESYRTR